jgi:O-antigen ligase
VISAALKPYQAKLSQTADALAIALAVSLPWSTSATGILVGLWLLAFLPTLDLAALRRELSIPAVATVILLVALAALGMLGSEASWRPALQGFTQFLKLLVIPLLFIHFRQSERALWVFGAFLISCALLLVVSTFIFVWQRPFGLRLNTHGIPVKDRIVQSGEFVLCAFGALYLALDFLRDGKRALAIALVALAAAFLANVFYIAASRTSLVVIPLLLLLWGFRRFSWKGTLAVAAGAFALGAVVWLSSPHLQQRVTDIFKEMQGYETTREVSSAGQRLDYWTKAIGFIKGAPIVGRGTGTTRQLFEQANRGETKDWQTANPHNQTLAVGIQLGIVGILALWALWLSHFLLFRGEAGLVAWIGEMVVVQNIVSSLFNSHLFDFTQGWIYVFGVGVAGGMILRRRAAAKSGADTQRPL